MSSLVSDLRRAPFCGQTALKRLASQLGGMRVTLAGLGHFGGGVGAARYLAASGADLTVTDLRSSDQLADSVRALDGLRIRFCLGRHAEEDFTGADLVVASPAVPRESPFLLAAARAGVPLTSPMNLFVSGCTAPVVGVTGSNGKSTTTTMLAAMLGEDGHRVWLGGNLGGSLLPQLGRIAPDDVVVLELSSFQLQDAAFLEWSPHVAVVTNVSPNHLDRHGTMADYVSAKHAVVRYQRSDDFAVLNAHDGHLAAWVGDGLRGKLYFFDAAPNPAALKRGCSLVDGRLIWRGSTGLEVLCTAGDLRVPGRHNVENALAAATAARCVGCSTAAVRDGVRGFAGLEHRLELAGDTGGIRFYNDSNSTTPASSIAAVRSFTGPVALIAGGYDKKLDLRPLAEAAAGSACVLVTLGATGPALADMARQASAGRRTGLEVCEARTLEEAVGLAVGHSEPGTAVVFSPGCASYDMFENYEARGRAFREVVADFVAGARQPAGREARTDASA